MTRSGALAMLALALALAASAATAQERCVAAAYRMPPSIGDEMRPYLLCGLISGQNHSGVRLNGSTVSMAGGGLANCAQVRSRAFEASDRRLAATMKDGAARLVFLEAEFAKAERFMRAAGALDDLGIGEEPTAPPCRNRNAPD